MNRHLNISTMVLLLLCSVHAYSQQHVLRGDFPDPSVVRIGSTYWATATTSNWAPVFPLLRSSDLVHWEKAGHVFNDPPEWADYYFWAPEINVDKGKVYVYYSAHRKGGNLCIGVASADRPEGPYKDHGPLMCQEVGSIDAFPIRDKAGKLHLVWKEDANSVNKPTPIWMMEMNEERTKLIGEKKELFRNDQPWEANLVEGVSMIQKGDYYYAFYAAAGCCGASCTYSVGIARSKELGGPWEKYEKNPVITSSEKWKCPGHGTPVEKDGRYYFLYHGYQGNSNIYTGREGLLSEFTFTDDGWIRFIDQQQTAGKVRVADVTEGFNDTLSTDDWQWSVFSKPQYKIADGRLYINASDQNAGAMLAHKIESGDYTVTVKLSTPQSGTTGGLGVAGDDKNAITATCDGERLSVVQLKEGKETELANVKGRISGSVYLRLKSTAGKWLTFYCSTNNRNFTAINKQPIDASLLPPWDRAVRVALFSKGPSDSSVAFDDFELKHTN